MLTTSVSLLQRLQQPGQADAWKRFVQLYTPLLWTWARREHVPADAIPDLIQEVLVLLVRKLPAFRYDPQQSFRAWLRTLLRNTWRNQPRNRGVQQLNRDQELPAPEEADGVAEAEYRQWLVGRALALMQTDFHPSTWQAFWECQMHGRAAAEVAKELGISVGSVYVARSRVLARLRQELAGLLE